MIKKTESLNKSLFKKEYSYSAAKQNVIEKINFIEKPQYNF